MDARKPPTFKPGYGAPDSNLAQQGRAVAALCYYTDQIERREESQALVYVVELCATLHRGRQHVGRDGPFRPAWLREVRTTWQMKAYTK